MSPRVVGAVQARLASTRLPKKALAPLAGEPLVWRVLERVRAAKSVAEVVLATSTDASDDELEKAIAARGVAVYRGPVDDIIDRLLVTAEGARADVLVRVWGDCPFVDPGLIDEGVATLLAEDLEFLTTTLPAKRTFPAGIDFEVYRLSTLRKMKEASSDPFLREFPFEYVTSGAFRWKQLASATNDSDLYLTVDYPSDLERAEEIYRHLFVPGAPFDRKALVDFCRAHPELGKAAGELTRNPEYFEKKKQRT